jgi:uncharacterized protein (TIGR02302 family)
MIDGQDDGRTDLDQAALGRRIAAALGRARLVLFVERAWPRLVAVGWVAGLFLATVWLDLWRGLPDLLHFPLLGLVFAAIVGVAVHGVAGLAGERAHWSRAAAIARIERTSGLSERELVGLLDRPADAADPATGFLWVAHRRRLARRIDRLAAGLPQPDLGRRDRYALRPALGMLLFVAWFAAEGEHLARLGAVFHGEPPVAGPEDRLDVWVDPPVYTGRPPVVIAGAAVGPRAGEGPVVVPIGSRITARVAAGGPETAAPVLALRLTGRDGRVAEAEAAVTEAVDAQPTRERALVVDADGELTIAVAGSERLRRAISVVPDRPPTIRLVAPPEASAAGALGLSYEISDDWGVVGAEARTELPRGAPSRALYEAPRFALALPAGRAETARAKTRRDLSAHPFAGARLGLTLAATDAIGQRGEGERIEMVLPERRFVDPTARALIDLRRRLALDARAASVVTGALRALTIRPERFDVPAQVHLGLRFLARRAFEARSDDDLRDLVDLMWTAATTIEAGRGAATEQALRAAAEALREALARGAPEDEIRRLTDDLRKALAQRLEALRDQARNDPRARNGQTGNRRIGARDLSRMLDRIEDLARTGAREAAQDLLSQLDDLTSRLVPGGEGAGGEGADPTEALGEMIRRQRKLMDETHRAGRGEGDREGLRQAQRELREALRGLGSEGAEPGEGLRSAGEAMDRADEALGEGETEAAVDAQGRAIEGLRAEARRLDAERRGSPGERGEDDAAGAEDPAGRWSRGGPSRGGPDLPGEIAVERARRILEDIRRRLSDPDRPRFEHDYLDRLQRFD